MTMAMVFVVFFQNQRSIIANDKGARKGLLLYLAYFTKLQSNFEDELGIYSSTGLVENCPIAATFNSQSLFSLT